MKWQKVARGEVDAARNHLHEAGLSLTHIADYLKNAGFPTESENVLELADGAYSLLRDVIDNWQKK